MRRKGGSRTRKDSKEDFQLTETKIVYAIFWLVVCITPRKCRRNNPDKMDVSVERWKVFPILKLL